MDNYIVADKLYGFNLEVGDYVRTNAGQELILSDIVPLQEGYELHYTDPFDEEEYVYLLGDDDTVDLLILE